MANKIKKFVIFIIATIVISSVLISTSPVTLVQAEKLSDYNIKVNKAVTKCYGDIPNGLKSYFKRENYHIIILDEGKNICDIFMYGAETEATGLIDYETNMIYVKYFNDEKIMEDILYHEIGHMLDESNGFVSETDNFDFIWNDREEFFSHFNTDTTYFKSSRRECFAQMYSIYKLYPNWLCSNYGYIYNYFMILEMK